MHQTINKTLLDLIGWFGALLFLIAYFLLIVKKWEPTSVTFHALNIAGGILLGVSTLFDHSYPAAFINFAWALIAVYGLYHDQLKKH